MILSETRLVGKLDKSTIHQQGESGMGLIIRSPLAKARHLLHGVVILLCSYTLNGTVQSQKCSFSSERSVPLHLPVPLASIATRNVRVQI
jgi:hypothetical protein